MTSVEDHFVASTKTVRKTYDAILRISRRLGPVEEEAKKTSIHLMRRSAFAGVATRKEALILTLKSKVKVDDPRVHKIEQTSANRWHLEVRLTDPAEVDAQIEGWLRSAYELAA